MPLGKNTDVESFEEENTIPSGAMVGYPGGITPYPRLYVSTSHPPLLSAITPSYASGHLTAKLRVNTHANGNLCFNCSRGRGRGGLFSANTTCCSRSLHELDGPTFKCYHTTCY